MTNSRSDTVFPRSPYSGSVCSLDLLQTTSTTKLAVFSWLASPQSIDGIVDYTQKPIQAYFCISRLTVVLIQVLHLQSFRTANAKRRAEKKSTSSSLAALKSRTCITFVIPTDDLDGKEKLAKPVIDITLAQPDFV